MFSEKNLPKLIVISPIIAIFLITFFTGYLFIKTQYDAFNEESTRFEKDFIQSKKDSLKNELKSIYNYLEHQESIYTNSANEKVLKRTYLLRSRLIQLQKDLDSNKNRDEILKNIIHSKTSDSNYFFAYDVKSKQIIQPDLKDIRKEFNTDDKFFENYLYSAEGKLIPFNKNDKIAFIIYLPDLDWIIGNIEDISSDIEFIKKVSKKYISTLKFDETGYSWILDNQNNIINEEDNVKKFKKDVLEINEGIYVNYKNKKKTIEMLSYVKYFEKWDWVLGTTLDLDYIQKSVTLEKANLKNRIEGYITSIVSLSLVVMLIITMISLVISNKISIAFQLYRINEKKQKQKLVDLNNNLAKKVELGIQEAQQKDRTMLHQSRLARLGTMLSMIAHQWRQPLTEVSAILAELETARQFNKIDNKMIYECINESDKLLTYMSNTIDDFRMFFKPDKEKEEFSLKKACSDSISLMKGTFKELNIKLNIRFDIDEIIEGYPREFSQVILNLLMNAKDIFVQREIDNAKIDFFVYKKGSEIYITIKDNAGGIEPDNLDKIFEPYFSTKKSRDATGLGLFMSKMIIEKNMDGKLQVINSTKGAEFNIIL